jgi:hypothetical protein
MEIDGLLFICYKCAEVKNQMVSPLKKSFAAEMANITIDIKERCVRNSKKRQAYYLSEEGFDWDSAGSPNFLNFNL